MALSPYYQRVKDDDPYLAFQFSEPSPNRPMDYIRGLELYASGSRAYRQDSTDGMGYSVKFNGGYFTTLSEHFSKSGYAFGIEFWTKMSGVPDSYPVQRILHRNGCFSAEINDLGQMKWVVRDVADDTHTITVDVTDKMTDNEWHHYFLNSDGTALKLYIDGVEAGSLTYHIPVSWPAGARFVMGAGLVDGTNTVSDEKPYFGWIDSFAFYKNAHTQDQIEEHWLLGVEPTFQPATGLVSEFGFRNSIGTIAHEMQATIDLGYTAALNSELAEIGRGQAWWSHGFPYRRKLSFTAPPNGIEAGHPMYVELPKSIIRQNKIEPDLSNIRAVYLRSDVPQVWDQLDMEASTDENGIFVRFPLAENIAPDEISEGKYYIYYGARSYYATERFDYTAYDEWFFTLLPSAADIDYTHPGKDWNDGVALYPMAKASLLFYGDRIRLWAERGPDKGIAEVQINDRPWQKIDLFHPTVSDEPVMTVTDLPQGANYFRYRMTGQNSPASLGKNINFTKIQYAKYSTFSDIGEEADDTKPWGSAIGGMINVNS